MKSITLAVIAAILLSGCNDKVSLRQVCQDKPQLCADMIPDGHCNTERRYVILNRYKEAKLPSDKHRYNLLIDVEKYSKCMALSSQIEHIKLKSKKTRRVDGYVASVKEINRLSDLTRSSDYPPLLFYHWSRNGSVAALEKFLALEGTQELNTPQLTYGLATYYIKRDLPRTIGLLYKSLSLYQEDEVINLEIFKSLSSINLKLEKHANAYLWAKIAKLAGAQDVNLEELKIELSNQGKATNALDDLAADTYDSIVDGEFHSPK
jgi:hypothetical protein